MLRTRNRGRAARFPSHLTRRIVALGYRVHLSRAVVETTLSSSTWREVWRYQLRWRRTIRV